MASRPKIPLLGLVRKNTLSIPGAVDEQNNSPASAMIAPEEAAHESESTDKPSSVTLSCGFTYPLPDVQYGSLKLFVSVSIGTPNNPLERRDAIVQASAEIEHYLREEMQLGVQRYREICSQL